LRLDEVDYHLGGLPGDTGNLGTWGKTGGKGENWKRTRGGKKKIRGTTGRPSHETNLKYQDEREKKVSR